MFAHLIASHNARVSERREAYLLKQLQDIPAWQGSIVHKVLHAELESFLPSRELPTQAHLVARAKDLARRQFAFSAEGLYRADGQTKGKSEGEFCALVIHEPGSQAPHDVLGQVLATLEQCFRNLFEQQDLLELIRTGSRHKFEPNVSIKLNNMTVTAVPDLIFLTPRGRLVVIDWKIGDSSTSDYSRQLLTYALVVSQSGWWSGVQPSSIDLYEVNLLNNYIRKHPIDEEKLLEVEDFIYLSGAQMEALVGGVKYADLDPSGFEISQNSNTCSYCHFQQMCIKWLEREGRGADLLVVGQEISAPASAELLSPVQGRLW